MKRIVTANIIIFILTIIILLSYRFFSSTIAGLGNQEEEDYRAVWVSYIEFEAFRDSASVNNESAFRRFFASVTDRCQRLHINRLIVQVRPFGDAIYSSTYYPWSACISGSQGSDPGYDPLKIMVEMAHGKDIKIEAWVNPYRVSATDDMATLSEKNPAVAWSKEKSTKRNVLTYEHALYYNPSSQRVRDLIYNGVREIVSNYDVDGIHLDDYFYPSFDEEHVSSSFDAPEYKDRLENGNIPQNKSLADWRRDNVNELVSQLYQIVRDAEKEKKKKLVFGISTAGNPDNLRSDLEHYVDIDRWINEEGYVDYIMPQIYWGYTSQEAPFARILKRWKRLCRRSHVRLYVGLALYRLGDDGTQASDYGEMQSANVIKKQIHQVSKDPALSGYSLFSYQYLDQENPFCLFETAGFPEKRKAALNEVADYLKSLK